MAVGLTTQILPAGIPTPSHALGPLAANFSSPVMEQPKRVEVGSQKLAKS